MLPSWVEAGCPAPSEEMRAAARRRQDQLTKPHGALGRLEELAVDMAGLQRTEKPRAGKAPIVVFAGDHGVTAQGVSAYPPEVTVEMLRNFTSGGAAISVLARELGSTLEVVDAGTRAHSPMPGVVWDKPRAGTRDMSREAALDSEELSFALECGRRAVTRAIAGDPDLLILGEMGIGNTTASAAIAAAFLACGAEDITGDGTGVDGEARRRKAEIVRDALALHRLAVAAGGNGDRAGEAERVLAAVGGLEIAALTGAIITAARASLPVLIDGFIVSVAALAAVRLSPTCRPWLIFSHRSAERGHRLVLDALGARPILDLDLRLGEGSGAAIALPVLRLACALHNSMATFAEAAVSGREV
jgi:nicotinate-nucleotide--dimethylbenzimidazole phosphoribosyltransferase